jgi:radical SAM superfamily enzyme YgiQ (UPF0313 family)
LLRLLADLGARVTTPPAAGGASEFPLPAIDLAGTQKYVPLLTARGCPFNCSYCASRLLHPVFLQRRPADILAEVEERSRVYKSQHFIIFDDALLINKKTRFLPVFSHLAREKTIPLRPMACMRGRSTGKPRRPCTRPDSPPCAWASNR